ncbi:MAG: cysteine peptidase family C39 domain-containing protein, partial [Planctomycetota bacterium]
MGGLGYYLATAALSLVTFAAGFVLGRRSRRAALGAAGVVLGLVVLKAVLHWKPEWEAALFPWADYVYFQSYWLYPTALLFFGLAAGQLPVRWNRAVVALVAATVFAHSLWAGRWMALPPDGSSTRRADARHHCRQSTGYTCVPASCVSLLSRLGIDATEGEMVRLCLTKRGGTAFFNTYRGLVLKLDGRPFDV